MTQAYDKAFKLLAGDDPRALLALFAGLALDSDVEVRQLDREVVPQNRLVDQVFEVTSPAEGTYLLHVEVTTRFRREVYERAAWQVNALVMAYRLSVRSYFVVMTAESFPEKELPPFEAAFGVFRMRVQPVVVRVWEIPGEAVLNMGRPSLYPWMTLVEATEEQQFEAARRVVESGSRESVVLVALLSGLRYRDKYRFLRRYIDVTVHELFEESDLYQMAIEKGVVKGKAEGKAEGKVEGERFMLLRQLSARFGIVSVEIEQRVLTADPETVERWGIQLLSAESIEEALA